MKDTVTWLLTLLLFIAVWLFVAACADSSTKGDVRDVKTEVNIKIPGNSGTIKICPDFDLESKSRTKQKTENEATLKTPVDGNVSVVPQ